MHADSFRGTLFSKFLLHLTEILVFCPSLLNSNLKPLHCNSLFFVPNEFLWLVKRKIVKSPEPAEYSFVILYFLGTVAS
jgi:hypothetical protein